MHKNHNEAVAHKLRRRRTRHVFELTLFAMLGALMFASKILMELLPNIHLLALFITVFTVVFRAKALIPIYVYVFLNGLYAGFAVWWVPYLYIWTVLWAMVMILPKKMPIPVACIVYSTVACLHGVLFGILYAPAQALLYGMNWEQTLAWITMGFPFDVIHGISNFAVGFSSVPLILITRKALKSTGVY